MESRSSPPSSPPLSPLPSDIFSSASSPFLHRAFIIVDVQNDFLPGGALSVPDGDAVIPVINNIRQIAHTSSIDIPLLSLPPSLSDRFDSAPSTPSVTRSTSSSTSSPPPEIVDSGELSYHKNDQTNPLSFFHQTVITQDWHPPNHCSFSLWPPHCVKDSPGASLSSSLSIRPNDLFIHKGESQSVDFYSAFFSTDYSQSTSLYSQLKELSITDLFISGLALDYCVKATAIDAITKLNYKRVFVIVDACRAVQQETGKQAVQEMKEAGIMLITSKQLMEMIEEWKKQIGEFSINTKQKQSQINQSINNENTNSPVPFPLL